MSRTIVDVDRNLLSQAANILSTPSMTATVNAALRQVVADQAHQDVLSSLAALDEEQLEILGGARDTAW